MSHDPNSTAVVMSAPAIPEDEVRLCLLAITKHGVAQALALARDLPQADICTSAKFAQACKDVPNRLHVYEGALSAEMGGLFARYDQLICFISLGAVVRLLAPHLKSKDEDPGVTVVDDAGQFVIPVLSGHIGAANQWSERVADLLGATAVLTTASDVGKTIAVDILGRHLGWRVESPKINITRVSAHVVNGEPVAVVQEAGSPNWWTRPTPLPANIALLSRFSQVQPDKHKAVLWITHASVAPAVWQQWHERLVVYRPPLAPDVRIAVGLGCDRGTPLATLQQALNQALAQAGAQPSQVAAVASITLKADEPALLALAHELGWQLVFYTPEQLAGVPVPNPSEVVRQYTGTPSVSEAAALLVGGRTASTALSADLLLVEKFKHKGADGKNATVSIARIPHD